MEQKPNSQLPPLPDAAATPPAAPPPPPADPVPADDCHNEPPELNDYDTPPMFNRGSFQRVFSFKGRITRAEFILSHLAIPLYFLVTTYVASICSDVASLIGGETVGQGAYNRVMLANLFVFCWFYTAQGVKRCHDAGLSGWLFYIPFFNIPMLFKAGRPGENRYGLRASLKAADSRERTAISSRRRRGLMCALAWLFCSPVYLILAVRWGIQKWMARIILFAVSPLVVCTVHTVRSTIVEQHATDNMEQQAAAYLAPEVIGVKLPTHELKWAPEMSDFGETTYVLTFDQAPSPALLDNIAALARRTGSGWTVYEDEAAATDDYGYYLEDYGHVAATDSAATPPALFHFVKNVRPKGADASAHVDLTIRRNEREALLKVTTE